MQNAFQTNNLLSTKYSSECWGEFIVRKHSCVYADVQKLVPVPQISFAAGLGV